jgi:nucleoside 2-deoxyribosyltransferase
MAETAPNVFVSYAWDDRDFAERVRSAVAQSGANALDPYSIEAASDLEGEVLKAVRAADVFVFVIPSREGLGKSALAELGAARALGKRIVALMPDRARAANSEVAVRLSDLIVLDAGEKTASTLAQQVLSALPSRRAH